MNQTLPYKYIDYSIYNIMKEIYLIRYIGGYGHYVVDYFVSQWFLFA